jgi:3-oxoadipate enol-lactonase
MTAETNVYSPGLSTCRVELGDDAWIHCTTDDYTDGWTQPDTVLMLHGIAEQGAIWGGWVPHFARRHRVVRPDLRGYGRSSALPSTGSSGRPFGLADWADDIEQVVAKLGRTRVHIVATKLGALVAFELAQRRLPWIASMTLAGMLPSPSGSLGPWLDEWLEVIERDSVEAWARMTMPGRMGGSMSPEAMEWWTRLMGTAPAATVAASLRLLPGIPGPTNPEGVECPTLFVAAGAKADSADYNQQPASSDLMRLKGRVRGAQWVEVPADSYHIAASHPDACAVEAAAFIGRVNEAARPQ